MGTLELVETVPPAGGVTILLGDVRLTGDRAITLRTAVQPVGAGGYERTIVEINGLRDIAPDWDSYGGGPIGEAAREHALSFVGTLLESKDPLSPPPEVSPSMDGGVMLRWTLSGRDVTAVFLDDRIDFSIIDRTTDEVIAEGTARDIKGFFDGHFSPNVRL